MSPGSKVQPRVHAAAVSVVAALLVLGAKLLGFMLTHSAAVFSDALESVVNVMAAAFAVLAIQRSALPASDEYPSGQARLEQVSAVFEGSLIIGASIWIAWTSVEALVAGHAPKALDAGMAITGATAVVNLVLGAWLMARGRALGSVALVADGTHVLTDVWTTVGVVVGLFAVKVTGLAWVDGFTALLMAVVLMVMGTRLICLALQDLVDREDPQSLNHIRETCRACLPAHAHIRDLSLQRSAQTRVVTCRVELPQEWTVAQAEKACEPALEALQKWAAAQDPDGQQPWVFFLCPVSRRP